MEKANKKVTEYFQIIFIDFITVCISELYMEIIAIIKKNRRKCSFLLRWLEAFYKSNKAYKNKNL